MSDVCYEMVPTLTCCGDQMNSRRGSDLETASLAAEALTGWARLASVSNFVEE